MRQPLGVRLQDGFGKKLPVGWRAPVIGERRSERESLSSQKVTALGRELIRPVVRHVDEKGSRRVADGRDILVKDPGGRPLVARVGEGFLTAQQPRVKRQQRRVGAAQGGQCLGALDAPVPGCGGVFQMTSADES